MKFINRIILSIIVSSIALVWACGGNTATAPSAPAGIDALRTSLAPYASLNLAKSAGYNTALTDCMSNGDLGAMGVHFGNTALIDATVDANRPEVLIYEPGLNGDMSLVGVEFVIPFTAIPKTATAPTLFGQSFIPNDVFGLWTLHVWTQRANPNGLFAEWNPRVHC
jgi:hypothetical protein